MRVKFCWSLAVERTKGNNQVGKLKQLNQQGREQWNWLLREAVRFPSLAQHPRLTTPDSICFLWVCLLQAGGQVGGSSQAGRRELKQQKFMTFYKPIFTPYNHYEVHWIFPPLVSCVSFSLQTTCGKIFLGKWCSAPQEIPGKPCKHHVLTPWRSEQDHSQIPHCLLSNQHLLWWSPALSSHSTFTAHGAVAVTPFYLSTHQHISLVMIYQGRDVVIFLEKGQICFSVGVWFGARNNSCKIVLLSCWLTLLLFLTAHRQPCWTEHRTQDLSSYSLLMTAQRT